jgi:hypothetical protein
MVASQKSFQRQKLFEQSARTPWPIKGNKFQTLTPISKFPSNKQKATNQLAVQYKRMFEH